MSLSLVKELREKTGAGLLDCQKALGEAEGDVEKALRLLRERGLAKAAKRSGRVASEGAVGTYIHPGGKIGVLLELNCETDFVAKTDEFQQLLRELAMQVAAASPRFVRREEVPEAEIENERAIYRKQAEQSGKPAQVIERIVTGQLDRFYKDACLLEQPYIKQGDRSVQDVVQEAVARLGENISIRRFARFQLGEGLERGAEQTEKESAPGGEAGA
ncbi:MAG: translation elongation factor Ts [bacterium]|nr:translation elongation factor Ts [bacterium]